MNFQRSEFACRDGCGFDTVDTETLELLEIVRSYFGAPVIVTSSCRCPAHNREVGGAPDSQHLRGRAADIKVKGVAAAEVYQLLDLWYPGKYGLGSYPSFTHVDTRSDGPARWKG